MYEKQQQLVEQVIEELDVCADMLGKKDAAKEKKYGFIPGMDELQSEARLRERIQSISQGIFQVMFTGTFSAGKSTILNALMRSEALATGPLPETAVITKLIFQSDKECAIIYKKELDENGRHKIVVMNDMDQFFQEYHIDRKDPEKFKKIVDYVVIHRKGPGIAGSMVQLIDSPGTGASQADDDVAKGFIKQADAIVFLINALEPLVKEDKKYIAEHFAGKQLNNVFFVVNKINLLTSDSDFEKLKVYIRDELEEVFLDKNGVFDQKLFDERVFYVDAFGSMNTRLGRETPITRNYKAMIPDNTTGVPEFEASLATYLGAEDRDKKALAAYRSQLAGFYVTAEDAKKKKLEILEQGADAIKVKLDGFEGKKGQFEREIEDIKADIETTKRDILRDMRDAYDHYVDAVEADWKEYFSDKSDAMKVHTGKLLWAKAKNVAAIWKDKDERQMALELESDEATKEFAEGIKLFLDEKSEFMSKEIASNIELRIGELANKLERHSCSLQSMDVPIDINDIVYTILRENDIKLPTEGKNNSNLAQALIAIFFADPELIVTAGGGSSTMLGFLIDVIKTNILDVILAAVLSALFGNFIGVILFVLTKLLKTGMRGDDLTQKMITNTMEVIINGSEEPNKNGNMIPGLKREGKAAYIASTEKKLGGVMTRTTNMLTKEIEGSLAAVKDELQNAYNDLVNQNTTYEQTEERMNKVLGTFAQAVSDMSVLTTGEKLTVGEIKKLASVQ